MDEAGLRQMVSQTGPTMKAHNGRDESFIDLVFASNGSRCCNATVVIEVPWNSSCHTPVIFSLCYERPTIRPKKPKAQRTLCVMEDTVDSSKFHDFMDAYLESFQVNLIHPHTASGPFTPGLQATGF